MEIFLRVRDEEIVRATFLTDGCSTTIACGSIATELAVAKPVTEAWKIRQETILGACDGLPEQDRHCALLAANTLQMALRNYEDLRRNPWKRAYRRIGEKPAPNPKES